MDLDSILNPGTLIFLIPVVAIIAGIVGRVLKHRERMAMIERGMHPDQLKIERAAPEQAERSPEAGLPPAPPASRPDDIRR